MQAVEEATRPYQDYVTTLFHPMEERTVKILIQTQLKQSHATLKVVIVSIFYNFTFFWFVRYALKTNKTSIFLKPKRDAKNQYFLKLKTQLMVVGVLGKRCMLAVPAVEVATRP